LTIFKANRRSSWRPYKSTERFQAGGVGPMRILAFSPSAVLN
jgi:hypothetical protein